MVFKYSGILAIRKNKILTFVETWMYLEGIIMLNEIRQTEKYKSKPHTS